MDVLGAIVQEFIIKGCKQIANVDAPPKRVWHNTKNIDDPKQRLKIIIRTICFASKENPSIQYVNESVLHRIIIAEGAKTYHTKAVDDENKEFFSQALTFSSFLFSLTFLLKNMWRKPFAQDMIFYVFKIYQMYEKKCPK